MIQRTFKTGLQFPQNRVPSNKSEKEYQPHEKMGDETPSRSKIDPTRRLDPSLIMSEAWLSSSLLLWLACIILDTEISSNDEMICNFKISVTSLAEPRHLLRNKSSNWCPNWVTDNFIIFKFPKYLWLWGFLDPLKLQKNKKWRIIKEIKQHNTGFKLQRSPA